MANSTSFVALAATAALAALPATARSSEGPIQDNSFLIEEAYNQEPGVIQHISTFTRSARTGEWAYSFTEEWPVGGQEHQASVTFSAAGLQAPAGTGVGDLALNYRWQAVGDGDAPVAIAPRLTVLLPTGDARKRLGSGGTGLQVNLPVSTVISGSLVAHTNVGGTWVPAARADGGGRQALGTFAVGQSLIWLLGQDFNLLGEVLYTTTGSGPRRVESLTLNPGIRAAFNLSGGLQVVPGLSVPLGVGPSRGERAVFAYLSFEHPFSGAGSTGSSR